MISPLLASALMAPGRQYRQRRRLSRPRLNARDKLLNSSLAQGSERFPAEGTQAANAVIDALDRADQSHVIIGPGAVSLAGGCIEPAAQAPELTRRFLAGAQGAGDKTAGLSERWLIADSRRDFAQSTRTPRTNVDQLILQILQDKKEHAKLPDLEVARVERSLKDHACANHF